MSFSFLRIELPTRPNNATVGVLLHLITLVFEDSEKEIRWEDGGQVLFFEDTSENVALFSRVLKERSWHEARFNPGRENDHFQIGVSVFGGEEKWSACLNQLLDTIISVEISPTEQIST